MNFKKYHVSKNLLQLSSIAETSLNGVTYRVQGNSLYIDGKSTAAFGIDIRGTFTLNAGTYTNQMYGFTERRLYYSFNNVSDTMCTSDVNTYKTFTISESTTYAKALLWINNNVVFDNERIDFALFESATPKDFEPYSSEVWHDTPHYIHNTSTDTITTLPAVLYPTGSTATVGLKGQTTQSSIPSPTPPVMPQGTGERTGNLWDEEYPNISGTIRYIPLYVGEGSFTLSTTTPYDNSVANIFLLSGNVSSGTSTSGNGAWVKHNVTAQSDDGYVTIAYRHYTGTTSPVDCQTMLNTGSTPLPYEPYGYKIPISSANTTTPVYLGEVQSTRRIKKYEFTGQETISQDLENYYTSLPTPGVPYSNMYCTHNVYGACSVNNNGGYIWFKISSWSDYTTAEDFKTFLQQQYANGTPVTVWYVLAEPETGIVNEPLMRIGDYADTLSNVSIPVTAGGDTLSVDTTVQPSEVTVNYKGWHPAIVHERTNGAWA